jgi:hypothetical protein
MKMAYHDHLAAHLFIRRRTQETLHHPQALKFYRAQKPSERKTMAIRTMFCFVRAPRSPNEMLDGTPYCPYSKMFASRNKPRSPRAPLAVPNMPGSKVRRSLTTMLMLGRECSSYSRQRDAMSAILAKSLGGYSPPSLGSAYLCTLRVASLGLAYRVQINAMISFSLWSSTYESKSPYP